ncbi:MAG: DUF2341 domain-containing protein, partial [Candidatus Bathyarchaeia archaeon]
MKYGKTIILLLILFLAFESFVFIHPASASSSWLDPWGRRRAVTIDNSQNLNSLTNYQVKLSVNFDSTMKSDFSDLRFTSDDGATLIPFWVESYVSSTSAVVWVNVPSVSASGSATIYMYYDNPSAVSVSSGKSTFTFYDDFETQSSPSSPWIDKAPIPANTADCTAAVYNNILYVFGGYNNGATDILNQTYAYDPTSNTWTKKTDMPTPRWGEISLQCNGKIYVMGGTSTGPVKYAGNPLAIPPYGAGGVVHPDVIYFPGGKDGYTYWMMYTPYNATASVSFENPSVVRSNDGITWTDAGISNPVISLGAPGAFNDLENPDPDFVYVSDYNKWFMVWDPGHAADGSRKIALAYSSDGKTWTQYGGTSINGNTDPIILSGDDTHGLPWERDTSGISKVCTPTLLYQNGVFYLYYADEAEGNNRGNAGLATFTWDDTTNSISSISRNTGNPIIALPQDNSVSRPYLSGCGHLNVAISPVSNDYYMYVVRQLSGAVDYQLVLLTSSDKINWVNRGTALSIGATGQWDDVGIYRTAPTVDETGKIVLVNNGIQMFYSAETTAALTKIGIAYSYPYNYPFMTNEIYDPVANSWSTGPNGPINLAYQGIMGVQYQNVIHLFYKNFHYVYDPVAGTFTQLADVPTPRTWGTCAVVGGKIYVIGGYQYDSLGNPVAPSSVNEVYDVASNTWATAAPLPNALYGITRENPVINGKIYVTHGFNNAVFSEATYVYDPVADSWTTGSPASHPRDGSACGVISGKLYVVGGRADTNGPYGVNYNEAYDPSLDTGSGGGGPTWVFSDPTKVYVDASAAHTGSYGLLVNDDTTNAAYQYAEIPLSLSSMVVDFDWDMTDALGTGTPGTAQPQGRILLVAPSSAASGTLYYFNDSGTANFEWFHSGTFTVLQSGSWNTWYHISIVWAGANSQVIINGVAYQVTADAVASDRVRLDTAYTEVSREYFDNVRVRQYSAPEPSASIGPQESYVYTVNFAQTGSTVAPTVTYQIDGGTPVQSAVPFSVSVDSGSSISYSYQSTVAGTTGTQYVLTDTSPGSPQTVTAPLTVTGTYNTQYYLTVNKNFGSVSPVSGWFNAGSPVTIYAVLSNSSSERYLWVGWTGSGSGSYTGAGNNSALVTMNGPITETASWTHQYLLTLAANFGTTSPAVGTSWVTDGSSVTLSAFATNSSSERFLWVGWTGVGSGSYTGAGNNSALVT